MYLIVGLGNHEEDYRNTRHNMGFDTINKISEEYNIGVNKKKFKGLCGTGVIEGEKVILLKPQTFMNLSGESVKEVVDFYKIENNDIIIIYDDIDIDLGTIKIRKKGNPGSHNGMKSVVKYLGTEFPRIRIGIGKPEDGDFIKYVIGPIPEEEKEILDRSTTLAKDATIEIIKQGVDNAMNKFNKKEG